ncbi:carbon-nitrogen hydrolase family protein [Methanomassiliicoccus luminyensis]|uniref:carbon-nitrogen hydrolase family protein n=1 Tax=Methanomassiliicoccus luminyensis TaxID=1080712 RepID=UPI00037C4462|nr:carbon-nitrogen hydrolase family protein [Methanomassiliicoccus luminyensis]
MKDKMRIALAQTPCKLGDKAENIARMRKMMERKEADLYVFPELYLTGYMVRDDIFRLAEGLDGDSVQAIMDLSEEHNAHVLFGMAAWDDELPGVLRNSAVMVSPDARVQRYDKINLASFGPFEEGFYFGAGNSGTLMDIDDHRIGVVVCYDLFFPELVRSYALSGAEAIVCISASPVTSRDFFEKLIPARAVENTAYIIYVNQVGTQLNQVFFGGSEAAGPRGDRIAKNRYFERDMNIIETSLSDLQAARRNRPTVRDTVSR